MTGMRHLQKLHQQYATSSDTMNEKNSHYTCTFARHIVGCRPMFKVISAAGSALNLQ